MTIASPLAESYKREAALAALDLVHSGMTLGLGTGSTANHLIEALGRKLASGELEDVVATATSNMCEDKARELGVPLQPLPAEGVDLAIDGMDEVDEQLRAIKGLGGALTREKIVAASARRFVLIGDASKRVERLAERTPVPVEVLPYGLERTMYALEGLGLVPQLRMKGEGEYRTDNGNPVVDCRVRVPNDLEHLAREISLLPGVIEHGFFLEEAHLCLIAGEDGIEYRQRPG